MIERRQERPAAAAPGDRGGAGVHRDNVETNDMPIARRALDAPASPPNPDDVAGARDLLHFLPLTSRAVLEKIQWRCAIAANFVVSGHDRGKRSANPSGSSKCKGRPSTGSGRPEFIEGEGRSS